MLDFFFPDQTPVVELDGADHDQCEEQDTYRTRFLAAYGYLVLRLGNEEVLTNLPDVLKRIVRAADFGSTAGAPSEDVPSERAPPLPEVGQGAGG